MRSYGDNAYVNYLKNLQGLDSSILLRLSQGIKQEDVAAELAVTRMTVSNCIKRNRYLYDQYVKPTAFRYGVTNKDQMATADTPSGESDRPRG